MRTLVTSNYGLYNNALITKLLEKNKPKQPTTTGMLISEEIQCDSPLVEIEVTQTQDGASVQTDNVFRNGCAPDNSGAGSLCFNDNCYPSFIFTDTQNTETQKEIDGEVFVPEEPLTFYLEQNPASPLVEVTLNKELIQTINTEQVGATACKR